MGLDNFNQFEGGSGGGGGGGTDGVAPFGVTYGGRNYYVKYPVGSSTYVDIRDLCPIYKDLPTLTLNQFYGPGNACLSGTEMDINDAWKETYELPFVFGDSTYTHKHFCIRGTVPQGKNCVGVITPDIRYLTMEDAQNKVNGLSTSHAEDKDFLTCRILAASNDDGLVLQRYDEKNSMWDNYLLRKKAWFKDGVIPKRLLVVMGGGGGRGGSYYGTAGNGGPSGGAVAFIVNIEDTEHPVEFRIGRGATEAGSDGVDTKLFVYGSYAGYTGYLNVATATGGKSSTQSHSGDVGTARIDTTLADSVWNIPSMRDKTNLTSSIFSGNKGASAGSPFRGSRNPETFIKTSNMTSVPINSTNQNILYCPEQLGGKASDGTSSAFGGGGGASLFAPGGDAGTSSAASGKDGHLGSGGGGGTRFVGKGGSGGDGYVAIYY